VIQVCFKLSIKLLLVQSPIFSASFGTHSIYLHSSFPMHN